MKTFIKAVTKCFEAYCRNYAESFVFKTTDGKYIVCDSTTGRVSIA